MGTPFRQPTPWKSSVAGSSPNDSGRPSEQVRSRCACGFSTVVVDGTDATAAAVATAVRTDPLRTFRPRPFVLHELVARGQAATTPRRPARDCGGGSVGVPRRGGTGSDKTTLLFTGLVPARERVVLVEDTAELRPAHPHVWHPRLERPMWRVRVRLRCGISSGRRYGCARPLVVGECRGSEVVDLPLVIDYSTGGDERRAWLTCQEGLHCVHVRYEDHRAQHERLVGDRTDHYLLRREGDRRRTESDEP